MRRKLNKFNGMYFLILLLFLVNWQAEGFSQVLQEDIWQANSSVQTMLKDGTTLYLGGGFTVIGPSSPNFTALDLTSAAPELGFPPVQGGEIRAIASDGAGGWYIGGKFTQVGDSSRNKLAHILADKTVGAWNPGANWDWSSFINAVAFSNGVVYFGGAFSITIGGQTRFEIAAVDTNGNIITNWNAQLEEWWTVNTIAISDTVVYFGGTFTSAAGQTRNRLAAVSVSGNLLPWNPDADSEVNSMAVRDTVVYVGGKFNNIGGQARTRCAAIGFSGKVIPGWIANTNAGSNTKVYAISIHDTTIYLGGNFTSINGSGRTRLAALGVSGTLLNWSPSASSASGGIVRAINRTGNVVYVGGDFTDVNGSPAEALAAVDATSGTTVAWEPGVSRSPGTPATRIWALEIVGSKIYAGGDFIIVGGKRRERVAAIDLNTNTLLPWTASIPTGTVNEMAIRNGTIYIGGSFTTVNGVGRNRLAALDASTGALLSWDPNAANTVTAMAIDDTIIYIGGNFTSVSGQTRTRLAAIGVSGALLSWDPSASSNVASILVQDTVIYVSGSFTSISGQTRNRLAAIGVSGSLLGWDPNASSTVNSIVLKDTIIYAGGNFTTLSGQSRNRLAAISTSGTLLPWNVGASSTVKELSLVSNTLYVGGNFTTLGDSSRTRLGSVDLTSGTVTTWNPTAGSSVSAIETYQQLVYLGGGFSSINDKIRYYFAAVTDPSLPLGAAFAVSPSHLDFGDVVIGASKTDSVSVSNTGDQTLTIFSVSSDNSRFSVSPTSGSILAGESLTFYITFQPDQEITESGNILFDHDASGSPDTVTVTGNGIQPPPTPGQTIFSGFAALDSSYAAAGTVIRAYRHASGTLIDTTVTTPMSGGINYAISILEGSGGVQDGDTIDFRVVDMSGTEVGLRYCHDQAPAIFQAALPPAIVTYNIRAAHQRILTIPVVQGYNAVSWNVLPADAGVASLFANLINTGKVQIILDYVNDGVNLPRFEFYIPELGQYNPFQVTDFRKGYFVRLFLGSAPDALSVSGLPVCHNIPIPLVAGFNFISYLPERRDSVAHALSSLDWSNVATVLDYINLGSGLPGDEYFEPYPQGNVFQLMRERRGYFVQLGAGTDTLRYPELFEAPFLESYANQPASAESMTFEELSGEFPMVMFAYGTEIHYQGQLVSEGSVLQARTSDGVVCGEATFPADGIVGMAIHKPETEADWVELYLDGELLPVQLQWGDFGAVHKLTDLSVTGIEDLSALPTKFDLYQNFPNPFNPETRIKFALPRPAEVNLTVYDILGQKVKTLLNSKMEAGYHSLVWDGRNAEGAKVASGIYLYRIHARSDQSQDFIRTFKMILMK